MNNKGFAISTMLYGALIVAMLVITLLISTMAFSKKSSNDFIKNLEEELNTMIDYK